MDCPLCYAVVSEDRLAHHFWEDHLEENRLEPWCFKCFCGSNIRLFNPWYGLDREDNVCVHLERNGGLWAHWVKHLLGGLHGPVLGVTPYFQASRRRYAMP